MDFNLRIPQDKRHLFTEPLDKLIAGTREETILQVENIFKDYLKSGIHINFYIVGDIVAKDFLACLLYTSPSPRDATLSRMPSSA